MAKQPIINGKVVERAYEDYRNEMYLVNRRYQRKLVWDVSEKKSFIDSLANGYPVPLFLFAKNDYRGMERYEIIDGLQRLNAIFCYIENEYPSESGYYFDLSSTALTKSLLDNAIVQQKQPMLERSVCVKIVSYELPFSIYDEKNPDIIDEVFRRINSNGQHLSRQEIRQAGATSTFAELVRKVSTQIRGDVSHEDILLLSKMKKISISKDSDGIDPDEVFWVKENILNKDDLRLSMDEEQIADILAAMVISPIPPSNVSVLDEYYGFKATDSETRSKKIEEAVSVITPEVLESQFLYVFDEIKKIFINRNKTIIGHILGPRVYRGPRYFQLLFLSLYDLLIKKEKKIEDYDLVYNKLSNISGVTMNIAGGGGWWTSKEKTELIQATSAVLEPCFANRNANDDPMYYSYTTELETLLKQSKTENSQYDFKQGLYNLRNNSFNTDLVKKIIKTLTAMANSENRAVGYVIIGVADDLQDAEKIKDKYQQNYVKVGTFYITGIDGEVTKYCEGNYDKYYSMIKEILLNEPISEHYRRQIGNKMRMVNYYNKSVIILKLTSDDGAVMYDDAYYTRIGASNDPTPVSPQEMPSFFAKFII